MIAAPKGVSWGTTNTPVEKRIDPEKIYKTRNGIRVVGLEIRLCNWRDKEVTFPVKGCIHKKGPGHKPVYLTWTLDGRASLFGDDPSDLVEVGTYYSLHDRQTGGFLGSGRNSLTEAECLEAGIRFLLSGEDREDPPVDEVLALSIEKRKHFLEASELEIRAHHAFMRGED